MAKSEAAAEPRISSLFEPNGPLSAAAIAQLRAHPGFAAAIRVLASRMLAIYRGNRPFADAACVALIRAAGGVILGKTVTTEFANRHPGPTVHPHNSAHTPGGSSSGSAAAVADFQTPLALGTQTGGSTIRPAAFCGVIGYKPSFGEFSRVGIKMQCHNLDTLGIICRSLEDVALLRGVLLAQEPHPVDRKSAAPRVSFCRTPAWEHADVDTHALLEHTASVLSAAGATVGEAELDPTNILDHHRRIR